MSTLTRIYGAGANLYRRTIPDSARRALRRAYRRLPGVPSGQSSKWGHYHTTKQSWENEYTAGKWEYMKSLHELGRYSVIVGYLQYLAPRGEILDVGGGEGILQERLGEQWYARFVGVDISEEAVQRGNARQIPRTTFVCADARSYVPDGQFEAIVFNEVLYYVPDPLAMLTHYEQFLKPGGVFIISMYVNDKTTANWQTLERQYQFIDETVTTNTPSSTRWVCRIWRKEGG